MPFRGQFATILAKQSSFPCLCIEWLNAIGVSSCRCSLASESLGPNPFMTLKYVSQLAVRRMMASSDRKFCVWIQWTFVWNDGRKNSCVNLAFLVFIQVYRIIHLLEDLCWVHMDLGCSSACPTLLGLLAIWQKCLDGYATWRNIQIQVNPTQASEQI